MLNSTYWYTYLLIDPRTEMPFYVGKGCKERMYQHSAGTHYNPYMLEKLGELKSLGLKVIYEKWFESDDEDFCYWMEYYLIDHFGRENLCNLTRGGDGPPSGENSATKDPKVQAKMRVARSAYIAANGPPFLGKNHTEESNQKNSASHIGLNAGEEHWTYGVSRTPETRAKIKEAVPRGEEHAWFGIKGEDHPAFGYKHTPEEIEAISQASKNSIANNPSIGFQKGRVSPNQGGETNGRAKLTESDVWALHDCYHIGKETIIRLAGDRKKCGYMSNLLTGNIWPKVHAAWHAKNPGFSLRIGEHRKDPEVTARRVANLVPLTPEARTAKAEKTWATRHRLKEESLAEG